ncbi:YdeI family protein [Roseateles sp. BYS78W]|uniref:YdeI family protein n=1 Tax=Pelomonas candidula TaxID=3299025 RepID=A0ABW7HCJ2_9BURK
MKQQGRLNPQFDEYQEAASDFAKPIMAHLRQLVHQQCPEVIEEIKWGIPHFDYKGEALCIFAAYKNHCSFGFWKEPLMSDARLKANRDLKAAKRFMGKLTSLSDLPPDGELIAFIQEAMALNDQGVKLPPRQDVKAAKAAEIAVPEAFAEQLSRHAQANEVFQSKSPSFRKEYVVWIADAKTEQTRQKRIDEALEWIAQGKGRFWKYEKK